MNTTDFVICVGVIGLVISGGMSALMLSDLKKRLDHLYEKNVDYTDLYTLISVVKNAVDCTMTISVALVAIAITMLVLYVA